MVVFDPETIDSEMLTLVNDLPAGESRLHADSVGVRHVFLGGVETVADGRFLGITTGRVLRSGVDTETVLVG
jgi:N-acyl-D-aspartate/D-glutamate deacylase